MTLIKKEQASMALLAVILSVGLGLVGFNEVNFNKPLSVVSVNAPSYAPLPMLGSPSSPMLSSSSSPMLPGAPSSSGGGGGPVETTGTVTISRVVQQSQGIAGHVDFRQFETFAVIFERGVPLQGGYIQESEVTLKGDLWSGKWSVQIPVANATTFLFNTRSEIDRVGRVSSIQVKTRDVTEQVKGSKDIIKYSPFLVQVDEVKGKEAAPPFYMGAIMVVSQSLEMVAYASIVFIPIFGVILGGIFTIRRFAIPVTRKVWVKSLKEV